jgi:hypothetical protein
MTPITPTKTSICAIGTRDGNPETVWLTSLGGFVFGNVFDAAHQFLNSNEAGVVLEKLESEARYQAGEGFIVDKFETVPYFRS